MTEIGQHVHVVRLLVRKVVKKEHYLNSWGGDDISMIDIALEWIDNTSGGQQKSGMKPWMIHLLPDATHHPYSVPVGWKKHYSGGDKRLDRFGFTATYFFDYKFALFSVLAPFPFFR